MQHLDPLNCKQISKFFSPYLTAADDGWSGTNFDRPEFQRMLEDIEAGKINTVVVKDEAVIIGLKTLRLKKC